MSDIIALARSYLANNAAESGADVIIKDLVNELERLRAALKPFAEIPPDKPGSMKLVVVKATGPFHFLQADLDRAKAAVQHQWRGNNMGYESAREKEIAAIISEELDDPRLTWAAIDAAARRIVAGEGALRAALKPFADLGIGSGPDSQQDTYRIEYGAIRAARSASR